MLRVLTHRQAGSYFIGQTLSTLGDRALWLAMGIWVKMLTGSNAAAGLTFCFYILGTLLGPLGGMIVDRVRRRPLLIAANSATAGLILLLLLVQDRGDVWLIYLVMIGYGALGSIVSAAGTALVATMVPDDLLPEANSLLQAGSQGMRLIAPLLGAGLLAAVGAAGDIWADVASFAAANIALSVIRVTEKRPQPARQRVIAEASAGIRHLLGTVVLRQLVVSALLTVIAFGFVESVIFAVVGTGLREKPEFLGYLMTAMGIGAVIASTQAARVMKRVGEGQLIGLGMLAFACGALLLMTPWLPVVVVGIALFGVSLPWINIGIITIIQRRTPPELLGRTSAGFDFLFSPLQVLSITLGAGLIATLDYRVMLAIMAGLVAIAAAYLFTRPEQRLRAAPAPGYVTPEKAEI